MSFIDSYFVINDIDGVLKPAVYIGDTPAKNGLITQVESTQILNFEEFSKFVADSKLFPKSEGLCFVSGTISPSVCAKAALVYLHLEKDSLPANIREVHSWLVGICQVELMMTPRKDRNYLRSEDAYAFLQLLFNQIKQEMGFPENSALWSENMQLEYKTHCFRSGTERLLNSIFCNDLELPGVKENIHPYWDEVYRSQVFVNCCAKLINKVAVLDQRSYLGYVDPRVLIIWAREQPEHQNFVLLYQDRTKYFSDRVVPAYRYSLHSVPEHRYGAPCFNDSGIWNKLNREESQQRSSLGISQALIRWEGSQVYGESSWSCHSVLQPNKVVEIVGNLTQQKKHTI